MKDIEILLWGFAMLIEGKNYKPSMVKFLNQFSRKCEQHSPEQNEYLRGLFESFLKACSDLPKDAFFNKKNKRFNIALYEAVFTAACEKAFAERRPVAGVLDAERLHTLETDQEFVAADQAGTTQTINVEKRLNRARAIIGAL